MLYLTSKKAYNKNHHRQDFFSHDRLAVMDITGA